MTTISPFSLSLPYRTENRRFSALSCTKTGSTQPKLSAACFVVQSCLADADFVVSSNYCLIGTRQKVVLFCLSRRDEGARRECPREGRKASGECFSSSPHLAATLPQWRRTSPSIPTKKELPDGGSFCLPRRDEGLINSIR